MSVEVPNAGEVLNSLKKLFLDMGYTAQDLFGLAVKFFKEKEGSKALEVQYKDRGRMLALIKQTKFGKYVLNSSSDVGILNLAESDRIRMWQSLGDMTKEEAMQEFLTRVIKLSPLFDPYVRAHVELEKKRQKEELNQVMENANTQTQQEFAIRTELNRQTEKQFRTYAEFMYPRNYEAQRRLIEGLQEQHFTQYMEQAYNFRLQSTRHTIQLSSTGSNIQAEPYESNARNHRAIKEVTLPDIPRSNGTQPMKAQVYTATSLRPAPEIEPQSFMRDFSPPDLPKSKNSNSADNTRRCSAASTESSLNEKELESVETGASSKDTLAEKLTVKSVQTAPNDKNPETAATGTISKNAAAENITPKAVQTALNEEKPKTSATGLSSKEASTEKLAVKPILTEVATAEESKSVKMEQATTAEQSKSEKCNKQDVEQLQQVKETKASKPIEEVKAKTIAASTASAAKPNGEAHSAKSLTTDSVEADNATVSIEKIKSKTPVNGDILITTPNKITDVKSPEQNNNAQDKTPDKAVTQKKKRVIHFESSAISEKVIPNSHVTIKDRNEANPDSKVEPGNIWMRKDRQAFLKAAKLEPDSCVIIGSGETVTIRIPQHEQGRGMFCEFVTEAYDIGFGLFYERLQPLTDVEKTESSKPSADDDDAVKASAVARGGGWKSRRQVETIIPVERRNSDVDVICGSHAYPPYEGVYHIKFDNSFSYWHGKTVYYRVYYTR